MGAFFVSIKIIIEININIGNSKMNKITAKSRLSICITIDFIKSFSTQKNLYKKFIIHNILILL